VTKSITSALAALMLAASLTVAGPALVTQATAADCAADECPQPEPCQTADGSPCMTPPIDPCSAEGAAIVEAAQAQQQIQRQRATIKRLRAKLAARR
jgi:hypothetical protein